MNRLRPAVLVSLLLLSNTVVRDAGAARPSEEDYGDAPDPSYPTLLASNGARHTVSQHVYMGSRIDIDPDGQPDPNAEGDDNSTLPDEDGVVFTTTLRHGQAASMDVTVSTFGWLDAWFDWDRSGSWDANESVYSDFVDAGVNTINFVVPTTASAGKTFARFRFNTGGPLPVDGLAFDGEVEDYAVVIEADFGDAPDPDYPTLLANNGAWHVIVPNVHMGLEVDGEADGQPDIIGEGDDLASIPDDEDGVSFVTPLSPGLPTEIRVHVSENGWLDAWIDWDQSGSWEPGESIYSDFVGKDFNEIAFVVPTGASVGGTFARFRYNTVGPLTVDGPAPDGEVEDYLVFVEPPFFDLGDAPDPSYPTLLANNGAWHVIDWDVYLGWNIDEDADGQPHPDAQGDDLTNLPDEDGVVFVTPLVLNENAEVEVIASQHGYLDVWVDLDQSGYWDQDEVLISEWVSPGVNQILFFVPTGIPGQTFTRFRYNTVGPLPPYGGAFDGEVEDYVVVLVEQPLDFGDAPDPSYPTLLANDGARHTIVPGVFMGVTIDAELDGQPTPPADGDDLANQPDEDGVAFVAPFNPGLVSQVDVTVSQTGWLDAWFDFDMSGVWDAAELVYSGPVAPGLNPIPVNVPIGAVSGATYARFRYNTGGPLPVDGLAPDGEVEDYEVFIGEPVDLDFGDAPDQPYPTLLANNGASHVIVPNVFMGALIDADAEPDGQPHPTALGDDNAGVDDEDGVVFVTPLNPGQVAQVDVTVSMDGWLDFWCDFDQSGVWDAAELMYSGPVTVGLNSINYNVPAVAIPGAQVFSRFRYNLNGPLAVTGHAQHGEVEDYETIIGELDFGDAPDPSYPTLMASNGAWHPIVQGIRMGLLIDSEPDGQPDATASGDDVANQPDEDGANFVTALVPGQNAQINVSVSVPGWLDAWIDWDQSGVWDPGEVFYSAPVVPGPNPILFPVPAGAIPGTSFARFRFNTVGAIPPFGPAPDGEVEDYAVFIEEPQPDIDFGDAPDVPYPTLLANNGARHTVGSGLFLGVAVDGEPDGQPDPIAMGDDLLGAIPDDEDGVVFTTLLNPYNNANVDVTASAAGLLDAWIDFNNNGAWEASEQIFSSKPLAPGLNSLTFFVPAIGPGAQAFDTFARFRCSSTGGLAPDGPATDGEVEDYMVRIEDDLVSDANGDRTPTQYALYNAVPNPFNPQTTLTFALPTTSRVKLTIYDVRGRVVATLLDEERGPGIHDVVWDGRDDQQQPVASGVYLYSLEAGTFVETKRVVLVK